MRAALDLLPFVIFLYAWFRILNWIRHGRVQPRIALRAEENYDETDSNDTNTVE